MKKEMFSKCIYGAVQKSRNGQRGEGVDDFVTYCYVYFEGAGGYFMKQLRNGRYAI